MAGHALEGAEIAGLVLGVDHAGDQEQRPRLLLLLLDQRLGDDQAGAGIVAAVEPDLGALRRQFRQPALRQPLHAARPVDLLHRPLGSGVADLEAGRPDGGDRRGGVGVLMAAGQDRRGQVHQPVLVLVDHAAVLLIGEEILAVDLERAAEPLGGLDQHGLRGLGLLRADHDRAAGLDDAGLFGGDQLDAVAEIGLVVERNRHDQRNGRAR